MSPAARLSTPLIVILPSRVTPLPPLFTVRLLKVREAAYCTPAPLNSTVLPGFNVTPPVAVMLPLIAPELLSEPTPSVPLVTAGDCGLRTSLRSGDCGLLGPLLTTTDPGPEITLVPQSSLPLTVRVPLR